MIITTTKIISLLNIKIPVWTALVLSIFIIYFALKPAKEIVNTEIVYKDYWKPELPKYPIKASIITFYKWYPVDKLKTDTIKVPEYYSNYYLWQPEAIKQINNGIRLTVFDPGYLRFMDFDFKVPEKRFGHYLSIDLRYALIGQHRLSVRYEMKYNQYALFTEAGIMPKDFDAFVGGRYYIFKQ